MSVIVLVTRREQVHELVHWAALFGRARGTEVFVLRPEPKDAAGDDPLGAAIAEAIERSARLLPELPRGEAAPEETTAMEVVPVPGPDLVASVLGEIRERKADLLILPRRRAGTDGKGARELYQALFDSAPCHAMMLRPGADQEETAEKILVPTTGGKHAAEGFRLAADLAAASGGTVTALYVQTELGLDAEALGEKVLERAIPSSLADGPAPIERKVMLAGSVLEGIASEVPEYDLTLIGTSSQWFIRRILGRTLPERILAGPEGPSVAVFRKALPLRTRLGQATMNLLTSTVPQMGRSDRIALVDRLKKTSRWDFDFVFLTGLATLIAALGLVAENVAVVIGAMLVAPLMTPLIGAGLALVQGNLVFLRRSLATVIAGFVLALGIGAAVGLILAPEATREIVSRGSPGAIDLAVAFAAGMAAAWAIGRPGLSAALPGVAIAASLVPPIAAAGISLVTHAHRIAAGASLLFFTNLVAIVLGAGLSLFLAGVRAEHLHRRQSAWGRRLVLALFVLAAVALIWLSFQLAGPAGVE